MASLITLHECQANFEVVTVDFQQAEQSKPEFLAVNSKGRVPALITEQGVLTETPAILVYLAQQFPQAKLLPELPFEFARLQSFNSYLASTVHVNHAHKLRGSRWASNDSSFEDMRAKVPETMLAAFQLIEQDYLQGDWVMGEQYTVADAYLFTMASWLEGDGVEISHLPKIVAHRERMHARAAVKMALQR